MSALVAASLAWAAPPASAGTVPASGFTETTVLDGLTQPTNVAFAPDGRVLVAEKSGRIKIFDDLNDPSPAVYTDLEDDVHDYKDRGLLGLEVHPDFPSTPYAYALYATDHPIGGGPPDHGDTCPPDPGDGNCETGARLDRLTLTPPPGNAITERVLLIEDWCAAWPSHTIGNLEFAADGSLLVGGGDGANFNNADFGDLGSPPNACGDPPVGEEELPDPSTSEGGALRSQDLRTPGDPVTLDGTIARIDPDSITGAAWGDNPHVGADDDNEKRIIAYGFRNPFRFTVRPGTRELYVGDVGWGLWEEINRVPDYAAAPWAAGPRNHGWPCIEGDERNGNYDVEDNALCEALYNDTTSPDRAHGPWFKYKHGDPLGAPECTSGTSSISGLGFAQAPEYGPFQGALFFADYSRGCVWAMRAGAGGVPDQSTLQTVATGELVVDLEAGPGGEMYAVDIGAGVVRRYRFQAPDARISGPSLVDLNVPFQLDASGSTPPPPPSGQELSFTWDLDDDGAFDDGSGPTITHPGFGAEGVYRVRVRVDVEEPGDETWDIASMNVSAGSPPAVQITSPDPSVRWSAGDPITLSASATEDQNGGAPLSGDALQWDVTIEHCAYSDRSDCHSHTHAQPEGSTATIVGPDHEWPSHLKITVEATDSNGLTTSRTIESHPRQVAIAVNSSPQGIPISLNTTTQATPFTREVIASSTNRVGAPQIHALASGTYTFDVWDNGRARTHLFTATGPTCLTAIYTGPAGSPANPGSACDSSGGGSAPGGSGAGGAGGGSTPPAPSGGEPVSLPVPPRRTSEKDTIRLSKRALVIQQRIDAAALRRLNGANAWMDAGIVPSDISGGALGPASFQAGIPWAGGGPSQSGPPDPRPIEIVKKDKPKAKFSLSRRQVVINDKISRALFARAVATAKRMRDLTGGNLAEGAKLDPRVRYPGLVPGGPLPPSQEPEATALDIGPLPKAGKVSLSAKQLRKTQRRSQRAIILANRVNDQITGGLTDAQFRPGSIGTSRIG